MVEIEITNQKEIEDKPDLLLIMDLTEDCIQSEDMIEVKDEKQIHKYNEEVERLKENHEDVIEAEVRNQILVYQVLIDRNRIYFKDNWINLLEVKDKDIKEVKHLKLIHKGVKEAEVGNQINKEVHVEEDRVQKLIEVKQK